MHRWLLPMLVALSLPASGQLPVATGRSIAMSDTHWKLFIPSWYQHTGDEANVIINFHGDDATFRNNVLYAGLNSIIVTVNYSGLSSAYSAPFSSNINLFQTLMDDAIAKVRAESDFPDHTKFRTVTVSSFSAGYGAVREILKQPSYYNRIDELLAADSLYASFTSSTDHTPLASQMVDYKRFALDATLGRKLFFFSHSQVPTFTYCETRECADNLAAYVGDMPFTADNSQGLGTLDFYRYAHKGNFFMHGALGTDGDSHLEHLRYVGHFLREMQIARNVPEPGAAALGGAIAVLLFRRVR